MNMRVSSSKLRLIVPEVIQTSAMDCGPASLKAIMDGVGRHVSYGRLREACQTDVDGTSIDTLEEIAVQLGLNAEQIMLPVDHILLPEAHALPAIIVVVLPNGFTHFVVVWRHHAGRIVQMMDPATGRRWETTQQFLKRLYVHTFPVPVTAWYEWASSDEFLEPLRRRLRDLGIAVDSMAKIVGMAIDDADWQSLATLDASIRMTSAVIRSRGIRRGQQAAHVLQTLFEKTRIADNSFEVIPEPYWSVKAAPSDFDEEDEYLFLRGAVLIRVRDVALDTQAEITPTSEAEGEMTENQQLSPELVAALKEPPVRPWREFWRLLRVDGLFAPLALVAALALAATGVIVEGILFRNLLDLGRQLMIFELRLGVMVALLVFVSINLLLRFYITGDVLRLGRRLEARLRIAFFEKIPRLRDRYFHSRPVSDMTERCHSIHQLRLLPEQGQGFLQYFFEILLTTAGMVWVHPPMALVTLIVAALGLLVPLLMMPAMTEQDLRVRTHVGALGHYYLDALLGLVAVRTHRAERAIRREHESLLAEWVRTKINFLRLTIATEGIQIFVMLVGLVWIVLDYIIKVGDQGGVLLLAYWGLNLPFRARQVIYAARRYAIERNISLRLFEPLGAPEEDMTSSTAHASHDLSSDSLTEQTAGVDILMEHVEVRAAGHVILANIDLHIPAGSHVAVVGPSGAGKTSLVSLLLGWHRPTVGRVFIDNQPLDGPHLQQLRQETAWVDPSVQIWNRSFLDNLNYGNTASNEMMFAQVIDQAELRRLLETLPDGLQTMLGESGGLVSGGEGQRVRLGRAMLRRGVRLVILDEPFRGLGRDQRHLLLRRARQLWSDVTLLCITHDVSDTQTFERVLVIDGGQIVEDGVPTVLAQEMGSRYRTMLDVETQVQAELWGNSIWRRLWMEQGQLYEQTVQEKAS